MFVRRDSKRGELPLGLMYFKNKIKVQCNVFNHKKKIHLGMFDINQVESAFNCYKQFKENYIKQTANEYRNKIPDRLYFAMLEYKVEIED